MVVFFVQLHFTTRVRYGFLSVQLNYTIRQNNSTPEIVRLYTPHESRQKNAASPRNLARHSHPILQAAHNQQKKVISARISTLAEKLVAKEKDIHLDAHWNNESDVKDKAKIAEEKLYQEWNL